MAKAKAKAQENKPTAPAKSKTGYELNPDDKDSVVLMIEQGGFDPLTGKRLSQPTPIKLNIQAFKYFLSAHASQGFQIVEVINMPGEIKKEGRVVQASAEKVLKEMLDKREKDAKRMANRPANTESEKQTRDARVKAINDGTAYLKDIFSIK